MNQTNVKSLKLLHTSCFLHPEDMLSGILCDVKTCRQSSKFWRQMRQKLTDFYDMETQENSDVSLDLLVEMSR